MACHKHEYVEIKDGRSIYCKTCGKVNIIPCNHIWKKISSRDRVSYIGLSGPRTIGFIYILQCEICGDIKTIEHKL